MHKPLEMHFLITLSCGNVLPLDLDYKTIKQNTHKWFCTVPPTDQHVTSCPWTFMGRRFLLTSWGVQFPSSKSNHCRIAQVQSSNRKRDSTILMDLLKLPASGIKQFKPTGAHSGCFGLTNWQDETFMKTPPEKITWKLKQPTWKRKIIFQSFISGFHVKFQGCIFPSNRRHWRLSTWNKWYSQYWEFFPYTPEV